MLMIIGTVRINPGKLEQARPIMARMIALTLDEDGCEEYSYSVDVLDSGLIHVQEIWRDQAALDRHFASAHIADWRAAWPDLGIHDRKLRLYDVANVRPI